MDETGADMDGAVQQLRAAIPRGDAALTWWERLRGRFDFQPVRPVARDLPLGEL